MISLTETQKTIIRILFVDQASSRSILAKKLSLTNAALTLAIKPLLEEKIIREEKNDAQRVGRKELKLSLNPEYGYFLGIDVRKHNIYYSLMNIAGELIDTNSSKNMTLLEFYPKELNVIAIGVTVRGKITNNIIEEKYPSLAEELKEIGLPTFIFNNVDCLADIYSLAHPNDKTFLLVKYGPGVGSSIFVHGKPLGYLSELGHTYYYRDKTVEDTISYSALLGKELEENEGTEIILHDEEKLKEVMRVLSFALINADSLLSLQKIILSGALLTLEETKAKLKEWLLLLDKNFDVDKLCVYPNYNEYSLKKGCIGAFRKIFK